MIPEWNKRGRPRKTPNQTVQTSKPWTKDELTIIDDGLYGLARAVVKQWIEDGKPQVSYNGVLPWIQILKERSQDEIDKKK